MKICTKLNKVIYCSWSKPPPRMANTLNKSHDRDSNFLMRIVRPLMSVASIFIFLSITMDLKAWQDPPHFHTIRLEGVPNDITVIRSFRQITMVYFTLPDYKTIMDYNDMDKVYLEPTITDERHVYGYNQRDSTIIVTEVLNPEVQFKPSVYAHKHLVIYEGVASFYDTSGHMFFSFDMVNDTTTGQIDSVHPTDVHEIAAHVFIYSSENLEVYMDTLHKIFITHMYEDSGTVWLSTHFEFYGSSHQDVMPVFSLSYELDITPMEEFVYKVTNTKYSEVYASSASWRGSEGTAEKLAYDPDNKLLMKLHPNPVKDFLVLKFSGSLPDAELDLQVFAINGSLILTDRIALNHAQTLQLPESWPAGLYIIRASIGSTVFVEKFLKN